MSQWGDDYPDGNEADVDEPGADGTDGADQDARGEHADAPPPLYYASVDEFVRLYLRLVYRRRVDGRHRCWAGRWWEYEEAIIRLEALWRAWEHLRLDPATGMSLWWRDHADHHMPVLLDPDGPFSDATEGEENTNRRGDPLPYVAPPAGFPVSSGVNVSGPGMAWWVPDVGRIWCSATMRPLAASVAVATATVLAVTLVPDPAMASTVTPDTGSGVGAGQTPFQFGPDATEAGELVADDEVGAVVQARATGRRVEVLSLRSETSRTWVNADGTWTTEDAAGPVRFVDDAGVWQDIDLDFEVVPGADGASDVVAPQQHALGLTLPGGDGTAPPAAGEVSEVVGGAAPDGTVPVQALAPIAEPTGEQVQIGWPGALPEPVLDGPVATYEDVTAGVDLQVQATTVGYETFMVLDTRPAPGETVSWALPLQLDGATAVERADGAIEFVSTGEVDGGADGGTPAGEVVSVLPPAHAWDAQLDPVGQVPTRYSDVSMTLTELADGTPAVLVSPDQAWLQDPATQFPVTVDPAYASVNDGAVADTYVQSDTGSLVHGGGTELRLGTYDGGGAVARSYLSFNTAGLTGKTIMSAQLSLYETYSYSCTARGWEAWSANAFSESSTTWANRPAFVSRFGTSTETKGYSSSCAAGRSRVDVLPLAKIWAADPAGTRTIGLKAASETDSLGWKKFRSRESTTPPLLVYTYNRAPAVPVPSTSSGVVYSGVTYTATRVPVLTAKPVDPDANTVKVEHQVHGSTAGTNQSLLAVCWSKLVASGTAGSCDSPQLPDNTVVYLRSRATDEVGAHSAFSAWTSFVVTTTAPPPPTITCTGYPNGSWTTAPPAADVPCTMTGAGSGQNTPGWIVYTLDNGTQKVQQITPSTSTATAKYTVTVPKAINGRHVLKAQTKSRSGKLSTLVTWEAGWGGDVTMTSPTPGKLPNGTIAPATITTDVVPIDASSPPAGAQAGAPTARVRWRAAGTSDPNAGWNDAAGAFSLTSLSGGLTTQGRVVGRLHTAQLLTDAAAGVTLNARVPVTLQVQVCVKHGTAENCADNAGLVTRVPHAFGNGYPVAEAGPGQVALWTGEFSTSATDISVPGYTGDLSIARTHATYANAGSAADVVTGAFGPGWTANFDGPDAGVAGDELIDSTTYDGTLVLFTEDDTPLIWRTSSGSRRTGTSFATGTWTPLDEDTRASGVVLRTTVAGNATTKARATVTLEDGTVTTFETQKSPGTAELTTGEAKWAPVSVTEPGVAGQTSYTRDTAGRITRILAPAPPGVTCPTTTTLVAGCRALDITYATTTSTSATGDVAGQIKTVSANLWDPAANAGAGAMSVVPVATYTYSTSSKRLLTVTDPRTGLATQYTYDGTRLTSVTPAGLTPVQLAYATTTQAGTGAPYSRFDRASRVRPGGGEAAVLAKVVYDVPVSGTAATGKGLLDLTDVAGRLGQQRVPATGYAVFGPDAPQAALAALTPAAIGNLTAEQWRYASLQYADPEGYTVNAASYGAGAWQVSATDYDTKGNVVMSLDERAVAAVLDPDLEQDPQQLATLTFYDADGILVTDTLGPARYAIRPDGSEAWTREWTHTDYDQGAPTTAPAGSNPATGLPWRLPTTETSLAINGEITTVEAATAEYPTPSAATGDGVLSRSSTSYGSTVESWTLGLPTATTIDVDASGPGTTPGDITTTTVYDTEGKTVATGLPGATASTTSTDPGVTLTRYYTAGTDTLDPLCGGKPQWAGLECLTTPAGQPTGTLPALPDTRTTAYNVWLQPQTVIETSRTNAAGTGAGSSQVTRTSTTRYDSAGRTTGSHTVIGDNQPLPGAVASTGSTTTYDPATGLALTITETTPGSYTSTGRTTSTGYDAWGRPTTYTGDDGLTTTTTYDAAGRVASVTTPVGGGTAGPVTSHVTSYTYDGTDSRGDEERRGLVTAIAVTGLATQTGAYDPNGQIEHEKLPGRIERTRGYDHAGEPLEAVYYGPSTLRDPTSGALTPGELMPWIGWSQVNDVEGRVRAEWTPDTIGETPVLTLTDTTGANGELAATGRATGYARAYSYDRAERLTRVLDLTRTGPGGSTNPLDPQTEPSAGDGETLACVARAYTFDTRGRRLSQTSTTGPTTGETAGTCPAPGAPPAWTRTATYDTADRPLTGTSNQTNPSAAAVTGAYVYDALGRQLTIPAVDTPAHTSGDTTAGPIHITYDAADTARTISQDITVRTGTTPEGDPVTARVREATQLSLDSMARRQVETVTSTTLDTNGTPTGGPSLVSTLTRHYGDTSDNPTWTYTHTLARAGTPEIQERSVTAEGIGGYTATITSDHLTGALTSASLNVANLHGDITTTIPVDPVTNATGAGLGPAASSITSWKHTDEYGNPLTTATSNGVHVPKTIGGRPGAATTTGPAYGWLGIHERALTTTGLILMGARLYNATVGNFTSVDPVPGGNTTAFAYPQDPINQLDLDGKRRTWTQRLRLVAKWSGYAAFGACIVLSAGVCAAAGVAALGASIAYNGYRAYRKKISWRRAGWNVGVDAVGVAFKVKGVNRLTYHGAHNSFKYGSRAGAASGRRAARRGALYRAYNSSRAYVRSTGRSMKYSWRLRPRRSAGLAAVHSYYGYRSYRT